VLGSWLRAASAQLGLPDEPCAGCLTVLHELSEADGPLDLVQLAEAVRSLGPAEDEDAPCPECGEVHDLPALAAIVGYDEDSDLDDSLEHAEGAVAGLVSYGAATALTAAPAAPGGSGEARVRLTPLGQMLAESVFTGCAPSADADAAALVDVLGVVPPRIAARMAASWLAARSPAAAVGDLLAYAEAADPARRMIAMAFAMGVGPEAAPAWREWSTRPGCGAYARMWLTEQGEEVAEHPGDQAWLTVEAFSAANAATSPELARLVFGEALGHADPGEAAEVISLMSASGHPEAARFVEYVAAANENGLPAARPRRAGLPAGNVYQLKITLRGVVKPPVWRRIAVPAALPLDLLHEVIQQAMGWEDEHMHVFSTPRREYGIRDPELGHADERKVTVAEVLASPGATMGYTYDFGDDWEHDIVLEKVLPPGPAVGLSCLAGKGACPPEDCGGAWGYASLKEALADPDHEEHEDLLDWLGLDSAADFDPAQFSLDEVNARLSRIA
jgi:Plasmid pRiA4b ORF-3-like protein